MKKAILAALLAGLALWGSGCARQSMEALRPVGTLGFDRAAGQSVVSADSLHGQNSSETSLLLAAGPDPAGAAGALENWAGGGTLFFPHTRFVLIGEEAARQELWAVLDWFGNSGRARLDVPVYIVRGGQARELIIGGGTGEYRITPALEALGRESDSALTLLELVRQLTETGHALCPAVEAAPTGSHAPMAPEAVTLRPAGQAVLDGEGLTGFLPREEGLS